MQPILAASAPDLPADAPAGSTGADTPAPAFTALLAQKMQADAAPVAAPAPTADAPSAEQATTTTAEAGEGQHAPAHGHAPDSAAGAGAPAVTPGPDAALVAALWHSVRAVGARAGAAAAPTTSATPGTITASAPSADVHLAANAGEQVTAIATPLPGAAPDAAAPAKGDDLHGTPGSCAAPATPKDAAQPTGITLHAATSAAERAEARAALTPDIAGDAAARGPLVLPHVRPAVVVEPPAARPDTGAADVRGDARRARAASDARATTTDPTTEAHGEAESTATPAASPLASLPTAALAQLVGSAPATDRAYADAGDAPATPSDEASLGNAAQPGTAAAAAMAGASPLAATNGAAPAASRRGVDGDPSTPRGGRGGLLARGDGDGADRRPAGTIPAPGTGASTEDAPAVVPAAARTVADDAAHIEALGGNARVTELVVEREAQVTTPRTPTPGSSMPAARTADVHVAASDSAGAPAQAATPAPVNSLAELDAPARRLGDAFDAARSGTRAPLPTRDPAASDVPSPAAPRARTGGSRVLADSRDDATPRPARDGATVTPARPETPAHAAATSARAAQAAADASAPMAAVRTSAPAAAAPKAPIAGTAETPAAPVPLATDRITVKLGDEAGAPSIRVAIRGDRVDARIVTSDGALARSLETGSHELSASLQAQGFGDSRVQVRGTPSALDGAGLANLAGSAPAKASDAGAQQGEGEQRSPEQRHQGRFEDRPRQQQGRDGKRLLDEEER